MSEALTCDVVFSFTDEDNQEGQQGESSSDPMDSLYRDILSKERQQASLQDCQRERAGASHLSTLRIVPDQSQDSQRDNNQSQDSQRDNNQSQDSQRDNSQSKEASDHPSELQGEKSSLSVESKSSSDTSELQLAQDRPLAAPTQINISQPIGSLCGAVTARSEGPLTVRGEIETISDEEILKNRESEEGIQSIPRFRNYQPGNPSKVSTAASTSHKAV